MTGECSQCGSNVFYVRIWGSETRLNADILCNECSELFDRVVVSSHELTPGDSIKILEIINDYRKG